MAENQLFNLHFLKNTIAVLIIFSFLLIGIPNAQAQSVANDGWEKLTKLMKDEVEVKLKDGNTLTGTVTAVTDTSITLIRKNKSTEFNKENVATVSQIKKGKGGRGALIGAGAGFAAGAAIGAGISSGGDITTALTIPIIGGLGAGIGALTGWLASSKKARVIIYQTK